MIDSIMIEAKPDNYVTTDNARPTAVVLISGGLDSATTLAIARKEGFACHGLTFDYHQRHRIDIKAAKRVAQQLGVSSHQFVEINLRMFGGSALTDRIEVPKDRDASQMSLEIPVTYVPARNTIFFSYALGLSEVIGASNIFIGVNAVDYSGYPDCRPEYIQAFEKMANLATKVGVEGQRLTIHAPLIDMTKTEIIRHGLEMGVDYSLTHSCYDPTRDGNSCGRCDACLLRIRAFESLGMRDPVLPH